MDLIESIRFSELDSADLQTYARRNAARIGLNIPEVYVAAVLENLAALQVHASIVADQLTSDEAATCPTRET